MSCCDIFEKFNVDNNLVKEYEYWQLLVKKNQGYFGSCVAITKKHHELLGDLSPEEMVEYQLVAHEVETALKKAFNYDGIHHCLLMKKDKHTHFHIVPRFIADKTFAGTTWCDGYGPFIPGTTKEVTQEVLNQIRDEIKLKIHEAE